MKKIQMLKSRGLVTAALLLGGASLAFAQTTNYIVNEFPVSGSYQGTPFSNTTGTTPVGCAIWYGSSTMLFDGNTSDPNDMNSGNGDGSCYINVNLNDTSGNDMEDAIVPVPGNDNIWYNGSPAGVPLSQYKAVHFDILWDTVDSTIGIDQFNNVGSFNSALDNSDPNNNGVDFGLDVQVAGLGTTAPEPVTLEDVNIPDAASNGWASVTIPIDPSESGIDGACGILIKKWVSTPDDIPAGMNAYFWIANVWFEGSAAPPPPPTLQPPTTPTSGLNIFSSTEGNSFYDRQEVALVASNGVSWVGNATAGNPVSYSFTINGFPQNASAQYGCEAYLMMAANPSYYDNALDWNEPNVVSINLEQGNGSTIMNFTYKTNEPGAGTYTTIGTVTNTGNASALGTWTITFTSDTDVTMTAPNGNTSSFTFTNAYMFAETGSPGCYLYLGMQANNAGSMNKAVCYSQFSVSGVPAAVSDNFLTD